MKLLVAGGCGGCGHFLKPPADGGDGDVDVLMRVDSDDDAVIGTANGQVRWVR